MVTKQLITILTLCMVSLTSACQNEAKNNREKLSQALTKYDGFCNFSDGLCAVSKNKKWGFIDKSGNEVIPCIYDFVRDFDRGVAEVLEQYSPYSDENYNGKFEYIDKVGNKIKYQEVGGFSENLCPVKKDEKWGFIDTDGKEVIPCNLDYIAVSIFQDGLAAVMNNDEKWGFIDKLANEVIPCIYDRESLFSEGLAFVLQNEKTNCIDKKGNIMFSYNYVFDYLDEILYLFHEGLAAVHDKNYQYGFIDKSGNEVIPCIYDNVFPFSEGLAKVNKNDKWGFIDKKGKEVIPCIYNDAGDFKEGFASIYKDENRAYGFINKTGKIVFPVIYRVGTGGISNFSEGLVKVYDVNIEVYKYGFLDREGYFIGQGYVDPPK